MKSKHSNSGRKWQNCRRSRYTMRISIRRWKDFWTNITLSKYVSIPNCSPRYRVGQNLGSISISQARTRIMQLAEVGTKCYVARNSICLDTVIPLFGYGVDQNEFTENRGNLSGRFLSSSIKLLCHGAFSFCQRVGAYFWRVCLELSQQFFRSKEVNLNFL